MNIREAVFSVLSWKTGQFLGLIVEGLTCSSKETLAILHANMDAVLPSVVVARAT